MPKPDATLKAEPIGFDAKYLALIEKLCKSGFSHVETCSIEAHLYGAEQPAMFTMNSPDQDRATVIIMPMRV